MKCLKWLSSLFLVLVFSVCLTGCFELCFLGCDEGEITNAEPDPNDVVEIEWGDLQPFSVDTTGSGLPVWSFVFPEYEIEVESGRRFNYFPDSDNSANKIDLSVELRRNRLMFVCGVWYPGVHDCRWISSALIDDSRQWEIRITQDPPIWEGNYIIEDNTDMENLIGFTEVTGQLAIFGFDTLIDLASLSSLTSIGTLSIFYNDSLVALTGLENLEFLGGLYIGGNDSLTTLAALESLTSVAGHILIVESALISLEGLNNITSIEGNLEIHHNNSLTALGLDNLTSIGRFFIIQENIELCTYLAEDLRDQVLAGGGIGEDVMISGNKDCSSP